MFVPGGLHGIQQWNEAVCDGAWGRPFAWLGEKLRRALDMEDWAAFDRSFRRMEDLIAEIATGPDAPSTISILGGDIHFSYAAELQLRNGERLTSGVHQLVCSPIRNILAETRTARPGLRRVAPGALARRASAAVGAAATVAIQLGTRGRSAVRQHDGLAAGSRASVPPCSSNERVTPIRASSTSTWSSTDDWTQRGPSRRVSASD